MRITGKGQIRFCLGLLPLFCGTAHATAEELSAQQIIDRAVERSEEQRRSESALAYIDIRLDLRILFKSIRRRIVREWDDYSPFRTTN